MRYPSPNNFDVVFTPEYVEKSPSIIASGASAAELDRRLTIEGAALRLANVHCPDITPTLYADDELRDIHYLQMERLEPTRVSVSTALSIVDDLQARMPRSVPADSTDIPLDTQRTEQYVEASERRLNVLVAAGAVRGLTKVEAKRVNARMYRNVDFIDIFDTTFVHTDVQRRHFGRPRAGSSRPGGVKIFDFDQAHFGNELEDYAFMAVRQPSWRAQIRQHLVEKFADDPVKLAALDGALAYFADYFLVKGIYDRVHQSRGELFDKAARVYGRIALGLPQRRASAFAINHIEP